VRHIAWLDLLGRSEAWLTPSVKSRFGGFHRHYALTPQKGAASVAKVADVLAVFIDITGICISFLKLKMIGHLGQIIKKD
jgi:hypothetical protein